MGTLGGSFTRNTLADNRSPQLMTGSFSTLNGFKFGLLNSSTWTDTRMASTIYPPSGDEPRQIFMVASQIFHGSGSRGETYKVAFSYGLKNAGSQKLLAFMLMVLVHQALMISYLLDILDLSYKMMKQLLVLLTRLECFWLVL